MAFHGGKDDGLEYYSLGIVVLGDHEALGNATSVDVYFGSKDEGKMTFCPRKRGGKAENATGQKRV